MNKVFKSLLVAGIVAVSGYGINKSIKDDTTELNALTLVNIEALADGEDDGDFTPVKGRVKNVFCIKKVDFKIWGAGAEFGYRDKCKSGNDTCRPTRCL